MRSPIDRFQVNHHHISDEVSIHPSRDGMTVEVNISSRGMWYPISLSKSQWRRWKKAVDKAFETVEDDGGHDDSFSDGFKAGWKYGLEQKDEQKD